MTASYGKSLDSGCSTVVEHTPHDPEVVGSILMGRFTFSVNNVIEQEILLLPSFLFHFIQNFIINVKVSQDEK